MRPFPGILAGVLASISLVAAFACALAIIGPAANERTPLPSRVTTEPKEPALRLPAASATAPQLDVVPAARALSVAIPRAASRIHIATPAPAHAVDAAPAPVTKPAPAAPAAPTPGAPTPAAAATETPSPAIAAPSPPPARQPSPVAAVAHNAATVVEPVSPEAAATVQQVADLVGP